MVLAFRAEANAHFFVNVATSDVFMKFLEPVMLDETIRPAAIFAFLSGKEGGFDNGNGRIGDQNNDRSYPLKLRRQ